MIIGSLKEVFLSRAKDVFLFDCQVGGLSLEIRNAYREVLGSFIRFTGDIRVRQLTPDLVNMYLVNLSDGPGEGDEHDQRVMSQYGVIQTWIHWMYAQKFITERNGAVFKPPRMKNLFPSSLVQTLPRTWLI